MWRTWDITVKIPWNVPLSTHRTIVRKLLSRDFYTLRERFLPQYVGLLLGLLKSPSKEVQYLSNIVARDWRSNKGNNIGMIQVEYKIIPSVITPAEVRKQMTASPLLGHGGQHDWVLVDMESALEERLVMEEGEDMETLSMYIDQLCTYI